MGYRMVDYFVLIAIFVLYEYRIRRDERNLPDFNDMGVREAKNFLKKAEIELLIVMEMLQSVHDGQTSKMAKKRFGALDKCERYLEDAYNHLEWVSR